MINKCNILLMVFLGVILVGCGDQLTPVSPMPQKSEVPPPALATILIGATASPTTAVSTPTCIPREVSFSAVVTKVFDGDTIEIQRNGESTRLRYIGIDTPEMDALDQQPGREARQLNRDLVEGKTITVYQDVSSVDTYGRILGYVFVDNLFVNAELLGRGYAYPFTVPPDTQCANYFQQVFQHAVEKRTGLWAELGNEASACPDGCDYPREGCQIKGNLSSSGDRIYHLPGTEEYEETVIDPTRGERWFCSEQEALQNGWRPPR